MSFSFYSESEPEPGSPSSSGNKILVNESYLVRGFVPLATSSWATLACAWAFLINLRISRSRSVSSRRSKTVSLFLSLILHYDAVSFCTFRGFDKTYLKSAPASNKLSNTSTLSSWSSIRTARWRGVARSRRLMGSTSHSSCERMCSRTVVFPCDALLLV